MRHIRFPISATLKTMIAKICLSLWAAVSLVSASLSEEFQNELAGSKSLYLRQHADNPIHWQEWGNDVFERAKKLDKPVFISIGYSSCHWCHVMERETFQDLEIAKLMNENFINVKVDREELPDVDRHYMEFLQILTGSGGWPLNVFCLPDGTPFFGGTYFPPDDSRPGRVPPWPTVLDRVTSLYSGNREKLVEIGSRLLSKMRADPLQTGGTDSEFDLEIFTDKILAQIDYSNGGIKGEPKFPPYGIIEFLMAARNAWSIRENDEKVESIDLALIRTLDGIALGGIFDQVGGGFARYSVDETWNTPHFEKMLYDNAALIRLYSRAWQTYRRPLYHEVVAKTIGWLEENMSRDSVFAASMSAESDHEEGTYYLWSLEELHSILGERAETFAQTFNVTANGNFGADRNVLFLSKAIDEDWSAELNKLNESRKKRTPPETDEKIITSWNGMIIDALVEAGWIFGKDDWIRSAAESFDSLWDEARSPSGVFFRIPGGESPQQPVYLEDQVWMAKAALSLASKIEWIESGASEDYLKKASSVISGIVTYFEDEESAGMMFVYNPDALVDTNTREWFDAATPAGNSVWAEVAFWTNSIDPEIELGKGFADVVDYQKALTQQSLLAAPHAISTMIHDSNGYSVIKFGENISTDEIRSRIIDHSPWQPVALIPLGPDFPDGVQLCFGQKCLLASPNIDSVVAQMPIPVIP